MSNKMTIIDRVEQLEKQTPRLLHSINDSLDRRFHHLVSALNGVIRILGKEAVEKAMKDQDAEDLQKQAEAAKNQVEAGLKSGTIKATEKVTPKSLIVGIEYGLDGQPLPPGRVQLMFEQLSPLFQEVVLNKGADTDLDIPDGKGGSSGKFKVMEIYEMVEPSTEVPAAAVAQS